MPPLIRLLTSYWGATPAEAQTWWRAVCHSRWHVVQDFRRCVLFEAHRVRGLTAPDAVDATARFVATRASPAHVLHVLENLVQEGLLSRQDASEIESKVLEKVDAHGHWL